MWSRKRSVVIVAVLIIGAAILGGMFGQPVAAQVRAALVRDVDTAALAPVSFSVEYTLCCINDQRLVTTVPAGRRLVIDHISYYTSGTSSDQMVFGGLRAGQYGPVRLILEVNPPHVSAATSFTIQDGAQPVATYFEAGEDVWVSVSHSTGGTRTIQFAISGHLITP
jgi:hypothetical protein